MQANHKNVTINTITMYLQNILFSNELGKRWGMK